MRALPVITPVGQVFLAKRIAGAHRLIDIIPDKAALISQTFFTQANVFIHRTVGVTHSMSIFA